MLSMLEYGMVATLIGLLGSVVVPAVLTWSKEECMARTESRILQYPKGVRILVKGLWVIGIGLLILAGLALGGPHAVFAMAFAVIVNAVVLTLSLFVFGERVTWDEYHLHVFPLWGRMRTVPLSAVRACEFSKLWQQYHLTTDGHGMVKLNVHWVGLPELLDRLPCVTPPYPPK